MRRPRIPAVAIVAVTLALLVAAGFQTKTLSGSHAPAAAGAPTLQNGASPSPERALPEGEKCAAEQNGTTGHNPCKSCPTSLLPNCTRLSCDPCCFQCPGEPFIRCL